MDVSDNADDFRPRPVVAATAELNAFAERILAGEELSCSHFADNGHMFAPGGICLAKQTATHQRNLERAEIVRAHDVTVDGRNLRIRNSAILNDKSGLVESTKTSGNRRCAD